MPGRTAAEQDQHAQVGLSAIVVGQLRPYLPSVDPADDESVATFRMIMRALARKYAAASAVLSMRAYTAARRQAGVTQPFTPQPAPLPDLDRIDAASEWAVNDLIRPEPDRDSFDTLAEGSLQRLVQDTGRETIIDNGRRDRQAIGWVRVPSPAASKTGTCWFCAMLATRTALYRSKETASFQAHPGCNCHAEAIFHGHEPSAQVRQWQGLWTSTTGPYKGRGKAVAFRQAYEGREVTGRVRRSAKHGGSGARSTPAKAAEQRKVIVTPDKARELITMLERSNERSSSNPKLKGVIAANNRRIAELRALI